MNNKKPTKSYSQAYKDQGQPMKSMQPHQHNSYKQELLHSSLVRPSTYAKEKPLYHSHISAQQTSSFQMMQGLLRGVGEAANEQLVSQNDMEKWGQLLTNRYKMEAYKVALHRQIAKGNSQSLPHFKLLLFLLGQIQKSGVQVHFGDEIELEFNAEKLRQKSQQISSLREEKDRTEQELQEVSKEYQKYCSILMRSLKIQFKNNLFQGLNDPFPFAIPSIMPQTDEKKKSPLLPVSPTLC